MTTRPSFAARYWAALTDSHPPRRPAAGSGFADRYLAALAGRVAAAATARAFRRRCATVALALAAAVGAHGSPAFPAAAPPTGPDQQPPAQVSVLVDVSPGVRPEALAEQRSTVRLLVGLDPSADTVWDVTDYGGAPGTPVGTSSSAPAGTPADAVARAIDRLGPGAGGTRVIFLLVATSGFRSTSALDRALVRARSERIAVRPVGFGDADRSGLARYAVDEQRQGCPGAPEVVAGTADLVRAFAAARCLGVAGAPVDRGGAWLRVPPGAQVVVVVDRGRAGVDVRRQRHPPAGYWTVPLDQPGTAETPEVVVLWTFPQ
ncbi:hypothetical protein AB0I60_03905 [Actinosynnema sp. NPDC050436]|uniref:hypothetical protein n=1 Tax=Actinosynnema sp. NPDC050436 TaxID=3155659 RepID=UPI0033DA2294